MLSKNEDNFTDYLAAPDTHITSKFSVKYV